MRVSTFAAVMLAAACATPEVPGTHGGDELIARDWDRATWGQVGPGTLRRKQP
jgi:hypothetical protein